VEEKLEQPGLDIVVPEFNELIRQGERFEEQIAYLSRISRMHETFLVDDASTDGSWERIHEIVPKNTPSLHVVRMKENGHKVLAVKRALELCRSEYVLLSDFDSMVVDPQNLSNALRWFEEDPLLAGVVLRLCRRGPLSSASSRTWSTR